jgi:uncharacterized protein
VIKNAPKTKKSSYRQFVFGMLKAIRGAFLLQDTPHRIAVGTACGMFCFPLPTLGQMIIGAIMARLLGGNVVASLPWTWISNPVTTPFIWYGGYRIGLLVTPGDWPQISFTKMQEIIERFGSLTVSQAFTEGYQILIGIFVPLLVGTVLIGTICAFISYFIALRWVIVWQKRRSERYAQWKKPVPDNTVNTIDTPTPLTTPAQSQPINRPSVPIDTPTPSTTPAQSQPHAQLPPKSTHNDK